MLYKYFSAENGKDAVELLKKVCENNTLRASAPRSFNDPFEFKVTIDLKTDVQTARARYHTDNPGQSENEFLSWWKGLSSNNQWYIQQEIRKNLLSTHGVICLSETFDNYLMWSHYAKNHTGFCIGFDRKAIFDIQNISAYGNVQYMNKAPKFRYFVESEKNFIHKAFFFKSKCWKYEKEVRLIFEEQGLIKINSLAIKEVILGCRAFPELRTYANERCRTAPIHYWQMAECLSAYSLNRLPVETNVSFMTSHF